jgi:hypothetical protein
VILRGNLRPFPAGDLRLFEHGAMAEG